MKNLINSKIYLNVAVCFCLVILAGSANAQVAQGGTYTLTQTVTASGGASGTSASAGGNYSVEGTIGQNAAGTNQQNGSYKFQSGFWTEQSFAPTAAEVSVGGKVLTANGRGIENVRITMTGANGETRTVISSSFGYFRFDNVEVGGTYISASPHGDLHLVSRRRCVRFLMTRTTLIL